MAVAGCSSVHELWLAWVNFVKLLQPLLGGAACTSCVLSVGKFCRVVAAVAGCSSTCA